MTDYDDLGTVKQGATFTGTIAVLIDGAPQDLTATGWSVTAKARQTPEATTSVAVATTGTAALQGSEIPLTISATTTATMTPGTWYIDAKIDGPGDLVLISPTYTIEVERTITRDDA